MQLSFIAVLPKYLNLAIFVKDILHILISSVCPAFGPWDMHVYLAFFPPFTLHHPPLCSWHTVFYRYTTLYWLRFIAPYFQSLELCYLLWNTDHGAVTHQRIHVMKDRTYYDISKGNLWRTEHQQTFGIWRLESALKKISRYFCLCFLEWVLYAYWYVNKLYIVIPAKPSLCSLNIGP
jgi:hypothetical protein